MDIFAFCVKTKIRFQHCDPAGIVFYPRYYELINAAVEDLFEQKFGLTHKAICDANRGIPMKRINITFIRPSYLGDWINIYIQPSRIGRSSLACALRIESDSGECRVDGDFVLVYIDSISKTPTEIPDNVRSKGMDWISRSEFG